MSKLPQVKIYNSEKYAKKPWKNGGGISEELLVFPKEQDFTWRISVASIVKSGPFSQYEGYMRAIIPLEGVIALKHEHDPLTEHKLGPLESYRFQGAWNTSCVLKTRSARDFNFIYKPQLVSAQIATITLKNSLSLRLNGDIDFLYCAEGGLSLLQNQDDQNPLAFSAHELCEIKAQASNQTVLLKPTSKQQVAIIHICVKNR